MSDLLSDRDVADRLGLKGTRWVADQARAGVFPHLKVGRSRRYTEAHVEEILRICEERPKAARKRPEPAPGRPARGGEVRRFERKTPRKLRPSS